MEIKNYSSVSKEVLYNWLPHNLKAEEVIFFPDVCPGRSPLPTGTTVITKQEDWRRFTLSDIGCGMMFLKSDLHLEDFDTTEWDKLCNLLKISKNTQCDLGSGNHFLNCYVSNSEELYFVIHTGSRLEGKEVENLIDNPAKFDIEYKNTMEWAKGNRLGIKALIDKVFDKTEIILDKPHNSFEIFEDKVVIRKGTVKLLEGELSIIPSNMDGDMALVKAKKEIESAGYSISHGSGRKFSRSEAKKYANEYDYEALRRRVYIPKEISNDSIKTEAPFCYRDLDGCMELISDLVEEIERFTPVAYIGQL